MCFLSAKSFQNIKYNYADNTHLYMSVSPDDVNPVETLTLLKDINTWVQHPPVSSPPPAAAAAASPAECPTSKRKQALPF